ncbi:DUF6585 family protein [Streptomyces sp. NPDC048442]|uniref:DUF6585 family protein n=1 Tax=Streptomyces sp. NPDC048442 TaxID=3154823 RepID=UPI00342E5086
MAKRPDLTEPPTASVAALAAQGGLGQWSGWTYVPYGGLRYRKWKDCRLYLYAGGVVISDTRAGFEITRGWADTRVLVYRRSLNGGLTHSCHTLIDPAGVGVSIGPGDRTFRGGDKQMHGITEALNGPPFLYPGDWGDYIQEGITKTQLPSVLARIERGESVRFGAYSVDRHGVTGRKRTAAWTEIAHYETDEARLHLNNARNRSVGDAANTYDITNLNVFLNVVQRLKRGLAQ